MNLNARAGRMSSLIRPLQQNPRRNAGGFRWTFTFEAPSKSKMLEGGRSTVPR
jgi:hypothetical protein